MFDCKGKDASEVRSRHSLPGAFLVSRPILSERKKQASQSGYMLTLSRRGSIRVRSRSRSWLARCIVSSHSKTLYCTRMPTFLSVFMTFWRLRSFTMSYATTKYISITRISSKSYTISQMMADPVWPAWLEKLWWRQAWLTLEAAEPAVLPPYLGSTLRGAMGHLLRSALCECSGCGHECQRPDSCRYYSLFEQSRDGAKPFLLLAPPPPGLEEIAMGGPVNLPDRRPAEHRTHSHAALRSGLEVRSRRNAAVRFAPDGRGIQRVGCDSGRGCAVRPGAGWFAVPPGVGAGRFGTTALRPPVARCACAGARGAEPDCRE